MKKALSSVLIMMTLKVVGQNHLLGIKGGVNQTNIDANNFVDKTGDRTGITVGLTYDYLLNKHFSIGTDLLFNQRGFTVDIVFTDNRGNPTGEKYPINYRYAYTSLPVKAGFRFGNTIYGFANIGAVPSLLADAKVMAPTFSQDGKLTGNEIFDTTERVTEIDLAGLAEIGAGYKIKSKY